MLQPMPAWIIDPVAWPRGWNALGVALLLIEWLIRVLLIVRIVRRRCPGPESLGWIVLIGLVPFFGLFFYAFMGERQLGMRRVRRHEQIARSVDKAAVADALAGMQDWWQTHGQAQQLARAAQTLTDLPPVAGNTLELIDSASDLLDRLIADIDRAEHHVNMLYYIWGNSAHAGVVCDALARAAGRGVACRVMADAVGSRAWLKGPWPARLRAAGVHVQAGLPVNLFRRRLHRIDLRNHRKITVIDGHIAYCGSQNLTDERVRTRRIPPRYRFWIDATCRIQGPAATALQAAFLADWLTSTDEASIPDIKDYLTIPKPHGTSIVHVVPSGPTSRVDAIHQSLVTMLSVAQREIMMTTPYFVPDAAIKAAIVSASLRGVQVTLILPEQLDNAIVAAAARAHYAELLEAGVRIFHHQGGLLHAKAAVVDGELAMIGSANLDMRSFWINFECTLLVYDAPFAQRVRDLHKKYLGESTEVSKPQWDKRTWAQNLRDNSAQLLAPLL